MANKWLGIYALDKIPFLKEEGGFIVNTQTSTLPGEHWLAVNISSTTIHVFDPFGFYYPHLLMSKLFLIHKKILFNRIQRQAVTSETCGQHCLLWLDEQYKQS